MSKLTTELAQMTTNSATLAAATAQAAATAAATAAAEAAAREDRFMALIVDMQRQIKGVVERSQLPATAAIPTPISPTVSAKSDPNAAPRLDLDEPAASPASEEAKSITDEAVAASSNDTTMVLFSPANARDKAVQDAKPASPRGHNNGALGRTLDKKDSNTSNKSGQSNRSRSGHSETKDKRGTNAQRQSKKTKVTAAAAAATV